MGRAKRLSTAKLVNPSSRAGHEASKAGAVSCPQIRPGPCHVVELLPAAARRRRRAGARRGGGGGQGRARGDRHVAEGRARPGACARSEEHTSELQSLMRISYAVFCLKKKNNKKRIWKT